MADSPFFKDNCLSISKLDDPDWYLRVTSSADTTFTQCSLDNRLEMARDIIMTETSELFLILVLSSDQVDEFGRYFEDKCGRIVASPTESATNNNDGKRAWRHLSRIQDGVGLPLSDTPLTGLTRLFQII